MDLSCGLAFGKSLFRHPDNSGSILLMGHTPWVGCALICSFRNTHTLHCSIRSWKGGGTRPVKD